MMRSVVLSVKENEYVAASEVLGASRIRILMKEVIPNSISSVLIMATTDIGNQILMFSTLSFLGLGSAPPTPEWGMMVSDGADYFNICTSRTFFSMYSGSSSHSRSRLPRATT